MNDPVGWVVLARTDAQPTLSVLGVADATVAKNETAALESAKARLQGDCSSWKFAVFGVAQLEAKTKRNLAAALKALGFCGHNLDAVYEDIKQNIGQQAEVSH